MRQILLQQRDAVADILRSSQEFINQPEQFSTDRLEALLEHRAGRVQLIEQLEDERRRLMGEDNELNASLQPFHEEIQETVDTLAALDDRLKEMIFNAQLQLTNNMAFTPKFVNLRANVTNEYNASSRVLDITR
ncbi:hypothetical protein ES703_63242 [subsurface metagenome]